jgi:hypothetical protein
LSLQRSIAHSFRATSLFDRFIHSAPPFGLPDIFTLEGDIEIAVFCADGTVAVHDIHAFQRWKLDGVFNGITVAIGFIPDFIVWLKGGGRCGHGWWSKMVTFGWLD